MIDATRRESPVCAQNYKVLKESQVAKYCEVKAQQYYKQNLRDRIIPQQQALGNSGEQELNFNSKRPNQKDAKGGEVIFCDWLWGAWKDKKEKESIETAGTINIIILQKQKKVQ